MARLARIESLTRMTPPYVPMLLMPLPRFENSRNGEMRIISLGRGADVVRSLKCHALF